MRYLRLLSRCKYLIFRNFLSMAEVSYRFSIALIILLIKNWIKVLIFLNVS